MRKPVILAAIATLALGVVAAQTMSAVVVPIATEMLAQTISPFEMMQDARGLPVEVNDYAI
ncbi:MAG TPA: hypothetical protein VGH49_00885 [Xanthobacteraceae bacterium]